MSDGTSSEMVLMRGETVYALSASPDGECIALSRMLSSASEESHTFSVSRERITGILSVIGRTVSSEGRVNMVNVLCSPPSLSS